MYVCVSRDHTISIQSFPLSLSLTHTHTRSRDRVAIEIDIHMHSIYVQSYTVCDTHCRHTLYMIVCVSYTVCYDTLLCVCHVVCYGVATISRLLKIIVLSCRIQSLLQGSFAKETYNLKEPTSHSHPIFHIAVYMYNHILQYICAPCICTVIYRSVCVRSVYVQSYTPVCMCAVYM